MNVMVEGEQELEQELAEDASDRETRAFPAFPRVRYLHL